MLYYVLAAETGIEVSQTNLAHICEERPVSKCILLRLEALRLRIMNWVLWRQNQSLGPNINELTFSPPSYFILLSDSVLVECMFKNVSVSSRLSNLLVTNCS